MEIHQVLVSASPRDAITNSAFELQRLCERAGPSDIYARHIHPELAGRVHSLREYSRRRNINTSVDLLVFHASIGEPEVLSFIMQRPEKLVLVYHNISPPDAFRHFDPAFAGLLDAGRVELVALAKRAALALADSEFNAEELRAVGFRDVRVSPLILDMSHLTTLEPHGPTTQHLTNEIKGPVALFVGQALPHKRVDLLLAAYHALVTYLEPEAHLIIVGANRLPPYARALQHFIQELNLSRAWITGGVSGEELVAFYRRADLFVTATEHEGFCVPLLEAMAFDTPILARGLAAIPETLAGAGLVLPPQEDPILLAEGMAELINNRPLRDSLVAKGRDRVVEFDPEAARATFLRHILDVL
jgi:glycosyltransferase involved in cell wall biosynthesis